MWLNKILRLTDLPTSPTTFFPEITVVSSTSTLYRKKRGLLLGGYDGFDSDEEVEGDELQRYLYMGNTGYSPFDRDRIAL
jgi:hypothetical protein